MPRLKNRNFETFNDGTLNIYIQKDRKVIELKLKGIRFGNRVLGYKKFFDAKVLDESIERVVAVPKVDISQRDIVEIGEDKYQISLIQDKFDARPPHLQLHLKKGAIKYGSN